MLLSELYKRFAEHKEGRWIMRWENARQLYNFVKTNDVKTILDLGTGIGCSAAIIALALENKGEKNYTITSLEQLPKCITIAKELIPEELQAKMSLLHVPSVFFKTDKIPYTYFSNYESIPEGEYDLILNDGPSPIEENNTLVELPNGTILEMTLNNKIKAGCKIIFDGRITAIQILERYLGDNFYLLQSNNRFNVIERKNGDVIFKDTKLEAQKMTTYFEEYAGQKNITHN